MKALSPLQFYALGLALAAAIGVSIKFLGPDAGAVTGFLGALATLLLQMKPGGSPEQPQLIAKAEDEVSKVVKIVGPLAVLIGFLGLGACAAVTSQDATRAVISADVLKQLAFCQADSHGSLAAYGVCRDEVVRKFGIANVPVVLPAVDGGVQ